MGLLSSKHFKYPFRYAAFVKDFLRFLRLRPSNAGRLSVRWRDRRPRLTEKVAEFGFDRHYIYHPAWAARILAKLKPVRHVDISSSLYFNAIASAFVPIEFYEYRPADLRLDNFTSNHADLLHLPFADGSVPSLSCMHVVEHVGLGRYGDALDFDGDLKAITELERVATPNGSILFVVPMGDGRIEYNAHRLYRYEQVIEAFSKSSLREFAFIGEDASSGGLLQVPASELLAKAPRGCGCFWFIRHQAGMTQ
jgi:SAM-dependent methyltransferase